MADSDLITKLQEYEDVLQISSMVNDALRSMGWILVRGLSVLIDGLESITNQILLTNTFFNNEQVVEFVLTIQPFLYVLFAGSFLFTVYLLIFQKKFERESFLINLFITLLILGLLSPTMSRIQEFSDEAIAEIGTDSLYDGEASLSESILKRNVHDLIEHDSKNFDAATGESLNAIPTELIDNIRINEIFDKNNYDLSATGNKLAESYILWNGKETSLGKLDQSGVEWNNQYYYRYQPNWLTIFVTLGIMGFTLFSIAYKLARLSFELAIPLNVTSRFGWRVVFGQRDNHTGIDFSCTPSDTIHAVKSGTVIYSGNRGPYGNLVQVRHDNYITAYAHLSRLGVQTGQQIDAGQALGYYGTTGRSSGNHLHFEIKTSEWSGHIDPAPVFGF